MPELTKELADEITRVAFTQLRTSMIFKTPRLAKIKESEDLYQGVVEKQLKNPFNYSFPFMSGFVDHYLARIDEPPRAKFRHQELADLKTALKVDAAFNAEVTSPIQKYAMKDRWATKLAVYSGRAVYKYFAESWQGYTSHFEIKDHNDFHCEPDGGGDLEAHLFCGEQGVFRTKEQLLEGKDAGVYDAGQVAKLLSGTTKSDYKEVEDEMGQRLARSAALGLQPGTANYIGQDLFKFAEWYLTYKGQRWYALFDETSGIWIRLKSLKEITESELWPYTSWATHEDPRIFWTKGPCDDARDIHKYIVRAINQELYNREKINRGQRGYDPEMFPDVEALGDWRPDGLTPVDTKGGTRSIASGLFEFRVAGLNGTIDLVQFIDSYFGRKTGSTPGSEGQAERNKRVGIYFGEIQQIDEFIGLRNKSKKEAWANIAQRYLHGLDENLIGDKSIEVMGSGGVE